MSEGDSEEEPTMPNYTLLLEAEANGEAELIECFATNPWLALEKSRKAIGHHTVELREGTHSFGTFRPCFPQDRVWEISPSRSRAPRV
jgi:hypothetical protein